MTRKWLGLVLLVLILAPIIAVADEVDSGDHAYDISRNIESRNRAVIELVGNATGDGMYFDLSFNLSVNIHIINASVRLHLLQTNEFTEAVGDYNFINRAVLEFEFVAPYDDTFYLFIFNLNYNYAAYLDGWYAKDDTEPSAEIWGFASGDRFTRAERANVGCYFDDRFGIKEVWLYQGLYPLDSEAVNTTGPLNWTIDLGMNAFQVGNVQLEFRAEDNTGHVGSIYITIVIYDPNATTTNITEPIIDIVLLAALIVFAGIIGSVGYFGSRAPKVETVDLERPKKKGHRDRKKSKKRKKRWGE